MSTDDATETDGSQPGIARWLWPVLGLLIATVFAAVVLLVESGPSFTDASRPIAVLPAATLAGQSLSELAREPLAAVFVWMPG